MSQIVYFFLGVVVGAMAWQFIKSKTGQGNKRVKEGDKPIDDAQGKGPGLIEKQTEEKQANKEKILAYLAGRTEVSNNDIENLLSVSNATAERYLDELEKEGKLLQIGKTGRSVYYKKL